MVLGAIAAVVMVRFGRFRGSTGFAFMLTAPLVMPDVITGLSLLLLFVAMGHAFGWPSERGMFTIWLAHVTFCTAYVAVVITRVCARWIARLKRRQWIWGRRR